MLVVTTKQETDMAEGRLVKTWEAARGTNEDEWDVVTLHSYSHDHTPEDTFPQATAARITPSKRKPVSKDHKDIFVFSDAQIDYRRLPSGELIPIHDERAIDVAIQLMRFIQPEVIVNLGDTVDLACLSRFKPDSDHFHRTLGPAFQRVHDLYAQIRADHPNALIREVDSNHNTRLKDFVLKNMPQVYGMRRAGDPETEYPVMTYPYLANLGRLAVDWRGGYGADIFVYGEEYDRPPIVMAHGTESTNNGTTASKIMKNNPETHVVQGHDHSPQRAYRTNRAGQYLGYVIVGPLCGIRGEVPSYGSAVDDMGAVVPKRMNWQQSVLHIRDYEGHYEFNEIMINEGRATYMGKMFMSCYNSEQE